MSEQIRRVASFSIQASELRQVDDYCSAHDLSRSQAVRRGLKLLLVKSGDVQHGFDYSTVLKPARPQRPTREP